MNTAAYRELETLMREAEGQGRWLHVSDGRIARNLQRSVRKGAAISPAPGVFAPKAAWDEADPFERALRCIRSLAQAHPSLVFAGPSAALIHGLSVSQRDVSATYVAYAPGSYTRSTEQMRRVCVPTDTATLLSGVRVTSLEQTAFDCMRMLGFRRGLAVADSVLRTQNTTADSLARAIDQRFSGRHGIKDVRRIMSFANGLAANGGESMARAAIIELGYEIPSLQVEITNRLDGSKYYADFYWPNARGMPVVGELDGREKYVDTMMTDGRPMVDVLADERLRESRISAHDIRVMRFSYRDSQDEGRFRRILDAYGIPRRTS